MFKKLITKIKAICKNWGISTEDLDPRQYTASRPVKDSCSYTVNGEVDGKPYTATYLRNIFTFAGREVEVNPSLPTFKFADN